MIQIPRRTHPAAIQTLQVDMKALPRPTMQTAQRTQRQQTMTRQTQPPAIQLFPLLRPIHQVTPACLRMCVAWVLAGPLLLALLAYLAASTL